MERKLDWPELLEEALTAPGNLHGVYSRFYPYSFLNQMLLRQQGVQEPVATYKRFQAIGRQVLKGSRAKAIVRPITVKRENEAGDPETFTRFKLVNCIFGVSQTEGEELPPPEIPDWSLERATHVLKVRQIPFNGLDGNVQGFSRGREYAINPTAVFPTKTLFHELGHIVLGHTTPEAHAEYVLHRGIREFQAESTAYLCMNELEQINPVQAEVSRGYIESWLSGKRPSDTAIRHVFGATDQILRAGRAVEEPA